MSFLWRNGIKPKFQVIEFNPYRSWKWVVGFLWLRVHYDHHFEVLTSGYTKLIWVVAGVGFGVSLIGRLLANLCKHDLDKAIPALVREMNEHQASPHRTKCRNLTGLADM